MGSPSSKSNPVAGSDTARDSRRLQYLQAMGIPLWQRRSEASTDMRLSDKAAANTILPTSPAESGLPKTRPENQAPPPSSPASPVTAAPIPGAAPAATPAPSISFADRLLRSPMVEPVLPVASASTIDLLLFSGRSRSQSPSDPPAGGFLKPAESLLAKMLSAIGYELGHCIRSGVASNAAGQLAVQAAGAQALAWQSSLEHYLQQQPVRLVLYFSHELPSQIVTQIATQAPDELVKPLILGGSGLPCLQLHHPERLLAEPELKRQAWDVLKIAKTVLATAGEVTPGGAAHGHPQ